MRFLFFDRILEAERGKHMRACKLVALMDGYLADHFPRRAVMPSALIVESLAQVGGMLNYVNHDFAVEMVLTLVDGVRIFREVGQGELLILDMQMLHDLPYGATMRGEARAGDSIVATVARMAYAYEIVQDPQVIQRNRDRFAYVSGGVPLCPGGKA